MKDVLRTFASRFTSLLQSGISSPVGRICLAGLGIALLFVFYATCTTIVNQGEISVVMQFGKPVRVIAEPGLYVKLPFPFHQLHKLDGRLLMLEPRPAEFLTADKKNLILENTICYTISDPVLFMQTVRDKEGLEIRLSDLLSSHTGLLLGVRELSDIVNTDPQKLKFTAMNDELTALMSREGNELGVNIEQVFIKRVMIPAENAEAVYERMRAERNRIARKYTAEGEEMALKIRANADKQSREMLADAERQAAIIRGQAEAQAMKRYGETYRQNLGFYEYLRSLEAYKNMFNEQTTIILDEKSPILDTFFSGGEHENK